MSGAGKRSQPNLSVIVCVFDMPREAPRTILSAAVPYQKDVAGDDYEVIVVDNGSRRKLSREERKRRPAGVSLVDVPEPRPSPVFAMNWAARELARGDILLFAIDGARIFTDRLYAETLAAHDLVEDAFVYTLAWHLGPKVQMESTEESYDREVEDRLIAGSGWPDRPDGLFDIAVFAGSSSAGYFRPVNESNAFSVRRELFERLGGYDERFTTPGGGMCNLEIFRRYVTRPDARNVCLLSEGTFHQVHDGVATSRPQHAHRFDVEYREATGEDFEPPAYEALYLGTPRPSARRFLRQSLDVL